MAIEAPRGVSITKERDSALRQKAAVIVEPIAQKLHEWGFSADGVSLLGGGIVAAACALTALREHHPARENKTFLNRLPLGLVFLFGNGLDALDGTVARIEEANGVIKDPEHGDRLDNAVDRGEEAITGIMKMFLADFKGSRIGKTAAAARMLTNPLSSFTRAFGELQGKKVSEDGNDSQDQDGKAARVLKQVAGFLGTRGGRVLSDTAVILHPDLQPVADMVGTAANLFTAGSRTVQALKHHGKAEVSTQTQKQALHKLEFLGAVTLITWIAAGVTWKLLRDKKPSL